MVQPILLLKSVKTLTIEGYLLFMKCMKKESEKGGDSRTDAVTSQQCMFNLILTNQML